MGNFAEPRPRSPLSVLTLFGGLEAGFGAGPVLFLPPEGREDAPHRPKVGGGVTRSFMRWSWNYLRSLRPPPRRGGGWCHVLFCALVKDVLIHGCAEESAECGTAQRARSVARTGADIAVNATLCKARNGRTWTERPSPAA